MSETKSSHKGLWCLLSLILISAMLLASCAPAAATEAPAAATDVPAPQENVTINILMEQIPDTDYVEANLADFTAATGITVNVEKITYASMHEKLIPQLTAPAGAGSYDVIVVDKQWVGEFLCADWLIPLTDYIAKDKFDTSVYIPGIFKLVGEVNGVTYMLPFYNYTTGMLYRKDIFEDSQAQADYKAKYGKDLKVPTTVEEYAEVAKNLTRRNSAGELEFSGAIAQLERAASQFEFAILMFGEGGWYYDEDWKATINDEHGLKAMETLVDLYKTVMPAGATGYTFAEQMAYMGQGKAAMMLTYPVMVTLLNDPANSTIVGKVGFAVSPGGAGAQGGWGWAIPRSSPNPDAAWKFLSWIESFEIAKKRAIAGGQPTRTDVFSDSEVLAKWPDQAQAATRIAGAKAIPIICSSAQVPEIVSLAASQALAGDKTPKEAVDEAAAALDKLVIGDKLTGK